MSSWLICLWTTLWATKTVAAEAWVGFAIGIVIAIALAFHPTLKFPDNPYLDRSVSKLVGALSAFLGLIGGELLRIIRVGVCGLS